MAHGTLVANTADVSRVALAVRAERTVATNTDMNMLGCWKEVVVALQSAVDRHKAVAGVSGHGAGDAISAVVPIGAIQALVTDAGNVLITVVADGVVHFVATRSKFGVDAGTESSSRNSRRECMLRVVTMTILAEALPAKIVVFTSITVKEIGFGQLLDALIAGAHGNTADTGRSLDFQLGQVLLEAGQGRLGVESGRGEVGFSLRSGRGHAL